ncbi:holo-ACP synthase [Bacillus aquiflavi]|uniref:Holo-[acyl-carrier-protein] synthase n=1 Tax=Bacillus aquiflavi TaxID=2672567 RepID=A0A6B3VZN6_9BACI|nr:holo-ACP synthase [Bacillus aquiflavi]MBA4536836.1 holo-ACP synthase [Bacillus aquiflavi]NEY81203.1 holo-ACP synthase [Bacillus aquiflavi]UAC48486.1 holo-ACP synthase [Bacillus aquiflavi]
MILGVGIDIIEINRVRDLAERQNKFVDRILTMKEKQTYNRLSKNRKIEFLAGRFAAKEAFSKAVGTGIGKELSFEQIEIDYNEKGRPFVNKPFSQGVHLSISHSREYAVAQVVIEKIN